MLRQLSAVQDREFDLLVVGGGVVGACVARDAAQRGLSVALVEKRDFGSGTSANSLKIVHGGLRYLQRGDFRTMRESIRERRTWLRIAPHLVEPLPVVVPDYGEAHEDRLLIRAALLINDLVSLDRNRSLPDDRALPSGRLLSAAECREHVPSLPRRGLRGGVRFFDAQMYSAERLVLEVVRAAAAEGAVVANYVEMVRAERNGGGLVVELEDGLSGGRFRARARFLVTAAGPWLPETIRAAGGGVPAPRYAAALNLVIGDRGDGAGVALSSGEAEGGDGFRRLFVVPWRGRTLIGTAHYALVDGQGPGMDPEPLVRRFLEEVNLALPHAPVRRDDVLRVHFGLLPVGEGSTSVAAALLRTARVLEHAEPIISVASVKFTGARALAERVVDRVFARLGWSPPPCRTHSSPLPGAPSRRMSDVLADARRRHGHRFEADVLEHLVRSHGRGYEEIVQRALDEPGSARRVVPGSPVLVAQLVHGTSSEMALYPEDLLYRRTELGAIGPVSQSAERVAEAVLARTARAAC